jgi:hypothetical protein
VGRAPRAGVQGIAATTHNPHGLTRTSVRTLVIATLATAVQDKAQADSLIRCAPASTAWPSAAVVVVVAIATLEGVATAADLAQVAVVVAVTGLVARAVLGAHSTAERSFSRDGPDQGVRVRGRTAHVQ